MAARGTMPRFDRDDPSAVSDLYTACRDSIVQSGFPCKYKDALGFGALQLFIECGAYDSKRHKPGFVDDLKTLLPLEYVKTKGSEKKLYAEFKNVSPKLDTAGGARLQYVEKCQALPTYGGQFFSVKVKLKKKAKLVNRLLGLMQHTVVLIDEATKDVVETYQLSSMRRWAASPTSFTIDFGLDTDDFLSVLTEEGGEMSQAVASRIDYNKKQEVEEKACQAVLDAADALVAEAAGTAELVTLAKALAITLKVLIGKLQSRSAELPEKQQQYADLARQLSAGTSQMVEAAKSCAAQEGEAAAQAALKETARSLRLFATRAMAEIKR